MPAPKPTPAEKHRRFCTTLSPTAIDGLTHLSRSTGLTRSTILARLVAAAAAGRSPGLLPKTPQHAPSVAYCKAHLP